MDIFSIMTYEATRLDNITITCGFYLRSDKVLLLLHISFRKCFITNADCMSTQSIIGVLNKNFANALWVPKDHQLDPDLPSYFQNVIKLYMGSEAKKEFQCVKVRTVSSLISKCSLLLAGSSAKHGT